MRYSFVILFTLLSFGGIAQNEPASKAFFNSVITLDETVNDFQMTSNYYPLRSNLDDSNSVIYIPEPITLEQIENAAVNIVSDFFYISKNGTRLLKIMLINKPTRSYFVGDLRTNDQNEYECNLKGDITENRANEIVFEKVDSSAKIEDGKLFFNGKEFTIIPTKEIRQSVLNLVTKYRLLDNPYSAVPRQKATPTAPAPKK